MDLKKAQDFIQRWNSLFDVNMSYFMIVTNEPNKAIYFRDKILDESDVNKAEARLAAIEKADKEYKQRYLSEQKSEELNKIIAKSKEYLKYTDWSMLSDAPLSQEGKSLYRNYRQYLRDIKELWSNKQILTLDAMTFNEWRENPPSYKSTKKVIL